MPMSSRRGALRRAFRIALLGSAAVAVGVASAADQQPLPTVFVTGTLDQNSAITQAPTLTPLDVTQPTSLIGKYYIENNMPLSSNYDDVVKIAPSVYSVSPNGPGLMENQILSIRGFQDGQYNVTFDGIPWGDANDFTHHTTSYFMDHDLGSVSIDRGPGTAATIGDATFGGTIAISSKGALKETTVTPYASFGSFNTQVIGAQYDTGTLSKYDGSAGFIDAESLSTNGYLSNAGLDRKNVFVKFGSPVDGNAVLTFVGMYNQVHQDVTLGATAAEIGRYGPAYALSTDPANQNYFGYNRDLINTDFEYVGLAADLGAGWSIDNKAYTYAYYHDGHNGEDPNGFTPNGTSYGPNNVPGQILENNYRSWGDTVNLRDALAFGDLRAGAWFDRQHNFRQLTEVDFTLGGATNPAGSPATGGIDRELTQVLTTVQPYLEFDWHALPGLVLSPGVRYDHFERSVDAQVNVKSAYAQAYTQTFSATLPSLLAHYEIRPNWTAYAQAAKGFLAPNENFFNFNKNSPTAISAASTNISPQQSWNYQAGTTWQTAALSLSADVYYINFANLIGSTTSGSDVLYFNQGGVIYKGVESEATFYLGAGLSLYANATYNSARDKGADLQNPGDWIANAPRSTAALGLIYNRFDWYASLLDKYVGTRYGDVGNAQELSAYSTLDGALGYTFGADAPVGVRNAKIRLEINNLLDSHKIYAVAGTTAGSDAQGISPYLYWTMPARSVFATVEWPF